MQASFPFICTVKISPELQNGTLTFDLKDYYRARRITMKIWNLWRMDYILPNWLLKVAIKFLFTAHSWQLPPVIPINRVLPLTIQILVCQSMPSLDFMAFVVTKAVRQIDSSTWTMCPLFFKNLSSIVPSTKSDTILPQFFLRCLIEQK